MPASTAIKYTTLAKFLCLALPIVQGRTTPIELNSQPVATSPIHHLDSPQAEQNFSPFSQSFWELRKELQIAQGNKQIAEILSSDEHEDKEEEKSTFVKSRLDESDDDIYALFGCPTPFENIKEFLNSRVAQGCKIYSTVIDSPLLNHEESPLKMLVAFNNSLYFRGSTFIHIFGNSPKLFRCLKEQSDKKSTLWLAAPILLVAYCALFARCVKAINARWIEQHRPADDEANQIGNSVEEYKEVSAPINMPERFFQPAAVPGRTVLSDLEIGLGNDTEVAYARLGD